ncbi:fish-egg lectin-like protein [Labeo rohita]|uniref:Fish-egg lectin-like protein n=1 Tax=Labeo rohita TaxID=84645 RepID=A0A498M573_LABRO|nr:fish-egg lectin-like protein [Labeo rohita]
MNPTGCSDGVKQEFQVVLAESVGQDISLAFKQHRNHRYQRVNVYDEAQDRETLDVQLRRSSLPKRDHCAAIITLRITAFDCTTVSGNLKQIDAGSGSVVGVNNKNEAFVLIDNVFTKISTSLTHFSVGPAGQLGVDSANKILKLKGGSFVEFPGILKQVDAGGDQILAGVSRGAVPYCSKMDTNNNWPWRTHISPWVKLSGSLKYYSCGLYSCWGVNSNDQIYIRKDVSNKACSGSGTSENIPGSLAMIEVATDGSVFGVNSKGALYRRHCYGSREIRKGLQRQRALLRQCGEEGEKLLLEWDAEGMCRCGKNIKKGVAVDDLEIKWMGMDWR